MSAKAVIYAATAAAAFFFAGWEMKMTRELTDEGLRRLRLEGFKAAPNSIRESMKRQKVLSGLPPSSRTKLKTIVLLKVCFVIALAVEVFFLQGSS